MKLKDLLKLQLFADDSGSGDGGSSEPEEILEADQIRTEMIRTMVEMMTMIRSRSRRKSTPWKR